ncbi:MAG: hypothetical protein KDB01_23975 [Planctomycetaceae bacterium]|nr:hypothetical protein [Planctomycetaceae bacterium]
MGSFLQPAERGRYEKDILSVVAIGMSLCAMVVASVAIARPSGDDGTAVRIDEINGRISLLGEEVGKNNLDHVDDIGTLMEAVERIETKVGLEKTDFFASKKDQ